MSEIVTTGDRALEPYVRHARKFGPHRVLATAAEDGFDTFMLARLQRELRRLAVPDQLDAKGRRVPASEDWRPRTQAINRSLGTDLLQRGAEVQFIANTLGVSRQWIRRRREQLSMLPPIREWHFDSGIEEVGQRPKTAESLALQRGGEITKPEGKVIACLHCKAPVFVSPGRGRPRRYCGDGCRRAYHRSREGVR